MCRIASLQDTQNVREPRPAPDPADGGRARVGSLPLLGRERGSATDMQPCEVVDDRYTLVRRLGAGGFGTVWEARDTRMRRPVALKIADRERNPEDAELLLGEALTAGGLNHPHIVTVHDYGSAVIQGQRRMYLVMELVDGDPLDAVLRRGLPPPAQALVWTRQICDALAAAHERGVVHQDVKPANILVRADGRAKLVDFGIAHHQAVGPAAAPDTLVGTLAYMAPERFEGAVADPRSDLYAVGCLLTELCTGRPPFTGSGLAEMHRRHVEATPPVLSALRPELPAALDELTARLLAKDLAGRPRTAAEVSARLAAFADPGAGRAPGSVGLGARPSSSAEPTLPPAPAKPPPGPVAGAARRTVERPRARTRTAFTVALVLVAVAVGGWFYVREGPDDGSRAAGPKPAPTATSSGRAPSSGTAPPSATPDEAGSPIADATSAGPADDPSPAKSTPSTGSSRAASGGAGSAAPTVDPRRTLVSGCHDVGYTGCPDGRACVYEGWDGTGWMGYAPACGTIDVGSLQYMVSSVRTSGNPVTLFDSHGDKVGHVDGWTSTNLAPQESDQAATVYVHCP